MRMRCSNKRILILFSGLWDGAWGHDGPHLLE